MSTKIKLKNIFTTGRIFYLPMSIFSIGIMYHLQQEGTSSLGLLAVGLILLINALSVAKELLE